MNYQYYSSVYQFYTLDVFTEQIFGGNPLAVFPEAKGLSDLQMQAIAQELNLSETVFVLPPDQADCHFKLRIFTPRAEIPFAGHPTVGTAYLLAHLNLVKSTQNIIYLEEGIGKVPVVINWEKNQVKTTALTAAQLPEFNTVPKFLNVAELLNLKPEELHQTLMPEVISCGLSFLYLPLNNLDVLNRCSLNNSIWESLKNTDAAHIYPFVITDNFIIHARMFAPALGITEDPATGSAATALAGYLHKHLNHNQALETWQIYQGLQMGRPSQLKLTMQRNHGVLEKISVGGSSVLVSECKMTLPQQQKSDPQLLENH